MVKKRLIKLTFDLVRVSYCRRQAELREYRLSFLLTLLAGFKGAQADHAIVGVGYWRKLLGRLLLNCFCGYYQQICLFIYFARQSW